MRKIPILSSLKDTITGSSVSRSLRNFDFNVKVNENVILENTTEGIERTAVVISDDNNENYSVFLLT